MEERVARMWTSAGGDNCWRRNESWVEGCGGRREGEEAVEVARGGSEAGRGEGSGRGLRRER